MEVVSALQGPSVEYLCMDATKLKFEDNSFDLVVEKGTLDALLTDEESQFSEKVEEGDGSVSSVVVTAVTAVRVAANEGPGERILIDALQVCVLVASLSSSRLASLSHRFVLHALWRGSRL